MVSEKEASSEMLEAAPGRIGIVRWTRDAAGWVEWPDGEWVRYSDHTTALAAKDAELAAVRADRDEWKVWAKQHHSDLRRAEAQLAEARKALGLMLREHDILSGNFGDVVDPKHRRPDRWPTAAEAARRALEAQEHGR